MYVVGLTGGIGSGKTTVSNAFNTLNITIVDSDIIAREVVEPGTRAFNAIKERFGESVISTEGTLNRPALRDIVFNSAKNLSWLQSITHPEIKTISKQRIETADSKYVILSSPLLIESEQAALTNRICVVDIPEHIQLIRTSLRDNTSQDAIKRILKKQLSRNERLAHADDVIDNSGSTENTLRQVNELHQQYMALANKQRTVL